MLLKKELMQGRIKMSRRPLFSEILDEVKSIKSIEDAISILEGLATAELDDHGGLYLDDHRRKIESAIKFTKKTFRSGVIR